MIGLRGVPPAAETPEHVTAGPMLGFLYRHANAAPLIAGFLFGTVGAIWSFAFDHSLGDELRQLTDLKADLTEQVRSLNGLANEYFIANHQGDLIFVLAYQDNARKDVAPLIYKANLLDRAAPVRNMIGALAIAKQLDYRKTYDAYKALNDAARADLSFAHFTKLKQAERELITKGQDRVPVLTKVLFEVETAIRRNGRSQKRNEVISLLSSSLGGFLLLLANLIASRQRDRPRDPVDLFAT